MLRGLKSRYHYVPMKQGLSEGKDSRTRVTVGVILQTSDLIVSCPDAKLKPEFPLPNANIMSGRKIPWTSQQKGLCPSLSRASMVISNSALHSRPLTTRFRGDPHGYNVGDLVLRADFSSSPQCWPDGPILVF